MDTYNSILKRIKTPSLISYPNNLKLRSKLALLDKNYKELELQRNLMTGLPEAWIYKRQPYSLLTLFFEPAKPSAKPVVLPIHNPPSARYTHSKLNSAIKDVFYFEEGKYRVGFFAPRNHHNAPLLYHGFSYKHLPSLYQPLGPFSTQLSKHTPL